MVAVSNNTGTILINDGNSVRYPEKGKVDITSDGTNVIIRWDDVHYVSYPATQFSAPSGTADSIAAAIAVFLNTGAAGGGVTSVSGTANRITSTGGAAPVIDISANYVGQTSITTLGTIGTGTWNATEISAAKGGTGQTVYAVGDLLFASTTTALSKLADVSVGSYLRSGGVGTAPLWSTVKLLNAGTANYIPYWVSANTQGESANLQFNGTGVGIGMAPVNILDITQNQNAVSIVNILNSNGGTAATANHRVSNGTSVGQMIQFGTGYTTSGVLMANSTFFGGNGVNGTSIAAYDASGVIKFSTGSSFVERMRLTTVGNLKIAGTAARATTEGTNHLDIFDGTAPVGTLANGISLYSTASELRVMDGFGNATLLSPHEKKTNLWIYDSIDSTTGKHLKIDMERMMKFLNDKFGTDFVHENFIN